MTEAQIQAEIVKYLRNHCEELVFSVPNEGAGKDAKIRNAHLIALGMMPGASDLIALWKDGTISCIEIKTPVGVQSDRQKHFQKLVEALGHEYILIRTVEEAKRLYARHRCPSLAWRKEDDGRWSYGYALKYQIVWNRAEEWTVTKGLGDQQHLFTVSRDRLDLVKAMCERDYNVLMRQICAFGNEVWLTRGGTA